MNQSLWNDIETNNYYLINNETGEKIRVTKTGEYVKEFDAALTGQVGYSERCRLATKPGYMPHKITSIGAQIKDFNPPINKIIGYTQCPHPVGRPKFEHLTTNKTHLTSLQKSVAKTLPAVKTVKQERSSTQMHSLLEPDRYEQISTIQHMDLNNEKHFKDMSSLFESQSYDYRSFNRPQNEQIVSVSIQDFQNELKSQKQQLDMFKLPQPKVIRVDTKGRFNVHLSSAKELMREDKMIAKLLYPDMFKEKKVDEAQEQLRRKINKLKEKEMLDRNLRNKA